MIKNTNVSTVCYWPVFSSPDTQNPRALILYGSKAAAPEDAALPSYRQLQEL